MLEVEEQVKDLEKVEGPSGFCSSCCFGFHSLTSHFCRPIAVKDNFPQDPLTLPSSLQSLIQSWSHTENQGSRKGSEDSEEVEEEMKEKINLVFLFPCMQPSKQIFQNCSIHFLLYNSCPAPNPRSIHHAFIRFFLSIHSKHLSCGNTYQTIGDK